MEQELADFFNESPLAELIKLPGRVVVHRHSLSPLEIRAIREAGVYGPASKREEICELEIGGVVVARGKIVRKRGEYYFKAGKVFMDSGAKEAGK